MSVSVYLNGEAGGDNTYQDLYTIFPAEHISVHNRPEGLSNNK